MSHDLAQENWLPATQLAVEVDSSPEATSALKILQEVDRHTGGSREMEYFEKSDARKFVTSSAGVLCSSPVSES